MLLADARLPSGGHAHSAGVEPALSCGNLSPEAIPEYLAARSASTVLVEAGTAVVARHMVLAGAGEQGLAAVERAWAARTPSDALREASRSLGRGYLRLARRVWPDAEELRALGGHEVAAPRSIVLGVIAAVAAMTPSDLVRQIIYDETAAAAAALLKLAPRDPADATVWVLRVCAGAEPRVPELAVLTDPADIPAAGAPLSEQWAQAHAALPRRLFRA